MIEYWLFSGSSYYEPGAGLDDLKARCSSRAGAMSAVVLDVDEENEDLFWAKVYEITPGAQRLVASFDDGKWSLR